MVALLRTIETEALSAERRAAGVPCHLPRPTWIGRVSAVVCVLLLAGCALLLIGLGKDGRELARTASERGESLRAQAEALPAAHLLRDAAATEAAILRQPERAALLRRERARQLAREQRWDEALAAYAQAADSALNGLPESDRLAVARILFTLGRQRQALAALDRLDFARLDAGLRSEALDLRERCRFMSGG